ncbi:MAG: propionate--CoA ligase [Burkholderiales bacterium]
MDKYRAAHRRSIAEPEAFWGELAAGIDWHKPFDRVLDYGHPPFARWFVGGETNLCHNAVDRHLRDRPDQPALIYVSTETGHEETFTYRQLHAEVNRVAAMLQSLGVGRGDRVLIYMPMVPEAIFAMLATVRIGAIHSVVFGGFASHSLASRIDDAKPKVLLTADAGMRAGKPVPYKLLLDEALRQATAPPAHVVILDRGLDKAMPRTAGRDRDWGELRAKHMNAQVPVMWIESNEPSYILYTSGTTGQPKGVQRDTGGYAVALRASMDLIYCARPGETFFSTSDIGWVVGHSYIVYAPLLAGLATLVYEGLPIRPDPGIWWKLVEQYRVSVMFTAPTAARVLKKQDPAWLSKYDLSSLRHLFVAGEPLDEPTARWLEETLKVPVIDHYWQTETGWPMLTSLPGIEPMKTRLGSPSFPAYGFNVKLLRESDGAEAAANEKGVVAVVPPLPPGCLSTVWGDDARFVQTYFSTSTASGQNVYSSFDWGIRDADGYYFILGRTDDVINVAGHRLGTREIEEAVSGHAGIAECAVVGVADPLKGQLPLAFAVVKDAARVETAEGRRALEQEVFATVDRALGAIGRPSRVLFVNQLPKTRSGKVLRRSIQAIAEGRDPGDLTTLDDPAGIEQIRQAVAAL